MIDVETAQGKVFLGLQIKQRGIMNIEEERKISNAKLDQGKMIPWKGFFKKI